MQFGPLTLKRCRYGWMLFSGPFIGKCFDLYGEYSESELEVMRTFVREGDVAHRRSATPQVHAQDAARARRDHAPHGVRIEVFRGSMSAKIGAISCHCGA
jgi:hypothetical protein